MVFGLIMLYSASFDFSYKEYGSSTYMFNRQVKWLGVGILCAIALSRFDYHHWRRLVVFAMLGTIALLIVVLVVNEIRLGASRTLYEGSYQPSEIAKLVAVGSASLATVEAQEPLTAMLVRVVFALGAGLALNVMLRREKSPGASRGLITFVALLGAALVTSLVREFAEQFILALDSNIRFLLALVVGGVTGAILGALIEVGLIRPLYARPIYQVLLTLGLVFVFDQVVRAIWGHTGFLMDSPSFFNTPGKECPSDDLWLWFSQHCDSVMIMGRAFPSYRLFIILIGVLIAVVVAVILRRSRLGMIIRAGVQDSAMVEALGAERGGGGGRVGHPVDRVALELQRGACLIPGLELVLRHATVDEDPHPAVHLREPHSVVAHFLLRHRPPVAEDGCVEIERQHPVDRREELDRAAAAWVVDDGNRVDDDVARVDRLQVRKLDDGVAVGVGPTKPVQPDLDTA